MKIKGKVMLYDYNGDRVLKMLKILGFKEIQNSGKNDSQYTILSNGTDTIMVEDRAYGRTDFYIIEEDSSNEK